MHVHENYVALKMVIVYYFFHFVKRNETQEMMRMIWQLLSNNPLVLLVRTETLRFEKVEMFFFVFLTVGPRYRNTQNS